MGAAGRMRAAAERLDLAQIYARRLLARHHGDLRAAGGEYDERHELHEGTGERLLQRLGVRGGPARIRGVTSITLDRLWVLS